MIIDTLAKELGRQLNKATKKPAPFKSLIGGDLIERFIRVDQKPIGRTSRSTAATYTGLFDEVRKIFALTTVAKQRGYKIGRFSFNAKEGRCEACQGLGQQKLEMKFLPDLYVLCPVCHGARFNPATLAVKFKEKSIAEVLAMTVEEGVKFFENHPAILKMTNALNEVGLGYLTLGQSSSTLSGGEAQRVKLASELGKITYGPTLYLLDEPTTGLHMGDIQKLLDVLQMLVGQGHTVLVIEHNLEVIKTADWVIDLGPEGGAAGGKILVSGTPEKVAKTKGSYTGEALLKVL